jgi:hypothetical protein
MPPVSRCSRLPRPWLFARNNGDYLLLFELGGAAVTLALAIDLIMALTVARKPPETRDDTGL